MKKLFTLLVLTSCTWAMTQAQITLPYSEDLEGEATGSTGCGAAQTLSAINWTNEVIDDVDWVIDINGTGSSSTGPTANGGADYIPGTTGGKYLYIEASGCVSDVALLTSDEIYTLGNEPNLFFEFGYHQYGAQIERLIVNTRQVVGGVPGPWVALDTLFTAPPGVDAWQIGTYDLSSFVGDTFQIQFNGLTGTSFGSDLALDGFSLFSIADIDAGITAFDAPLAPAALGPNNVAVTITNFGGFNLDSAMIGWEFDGVPQTPFAYVAPGSGLPTNGSEGFVTIGSANIASSGLYSFKAWTSMPNGAFDSIPGNDTITYTGCSGALRGTYTAGGPGADFVDMETLGFVLSTCGIDSHTVINVNPGFYNERLVLTSVPGTADTATLTIDGGSAATTTISNGSFSTIYLDGTSYTTIKNLTIEATGTADCYGVQLRDSAIFNMIDSCMIMMDDSSTNLSDVIGVSASNSETSSFTEGFNAFFTTVSNCTISGGEKGIHFEGQTSARNVGNMFMNNTLMNQEDYGFYMDDQDSITIFNNDITGLKSNFADGIYCFDIMMFDISENNVVNAPDYGIYIADGNFDAVPTSRGKLINNMASSSSDYACYLDDVNDIDIWHNTFASNGTGVLEAFRINDFNGLDIRNNIFYSEGSFAFTSDELLTSTTNTLDYNLYFTASGVNLIDEGPNLYADLASWQAAQATLNVNSVEGDPVFVNGLDDLHVLSPTPNDVGDNTVGVVVDIDGEVRPEAPSTVVDMGADEFSPANNDAVAVIISEPGSGCGDNITNVSVVFTSNGLLDITNLPITVNYSGPTSGTLSFTYTDTLSFGENDTVLIGSINTFNGGPFTFDGFVALAGDEDLTNDTFPTLNAEFTSAIPQAINGIGCGVDSAEIGAVEYPGAGFFWFGSNDVVNDTVPLASGSTFTVPSIAAQDTYFVEYANNADSLFVSVAGGNGQAGNMFDIVALNTVNITGLGMNLNTGSNTVEIWYRPDSYTNNPNSAAGWTQLGTATVNSTGNGQVTQVPIAFDVAIPAGQTYGFLAICTTGGVAYTNGTTVGTVWAANADLQVLEGTGRGIPAFTGATFSPRNFNGTVYYGSSACSNARIPVYATASPGVSTSLGNDTTICGGSLSLDAGTDADFYAWSTGDTTQMISADTTGTFAVVVSDTIGCEATDTLDLTVNPLPVVSVGNDTTLCGSSLTISATVDSTWDYLWSNTDTTSITDVTSSGNYSVVVTDSAGCEGTDSIEVTLNPNPVVDLGPDTTVCGSIELNASNQGATYLWNTGEIDRAITATTSDVYDVQVTDTLGCVGVDTVDVTVDLNGTLDTAAVVCGAFTWIDGNTYITDTIVPYIIAGGSANGCDSIITLDLDLTIVDTAVSQSGTTLTANAVGVSYQWVDCDNGNAPIAGATAQSYSPTANGNYAVEITDNGCTQSSACVNVTGLSIRGFGDASLMNLYPNPTENAFTVDFGSDMKSVELRILGVDGRVMQVHEAVDGQFFNVSLANYPAGMYFVEVNAQDGTVTSLKVSKF